MRKTLNDTVFYGMIFGLTLLRALTSKILPCPTDFDCNSYIQMANSIAYDANILPHHAMRILPALSVQFLTMLGMSMVNAFRLLSDGSYVIFGGLVFWVLRQYRINSWVAFGFTLLCLAPHHAMRIPLQNVYQTCDIMTYPLSLMMLYFSLQKRIRWVFSLALLGILVRQNLLVLGEFSLLYCFLQSKKLRDLLYIIMLTAAYLLLQAYYHASSIVSHHMVPSADFFSISHILWIIEDSKLLHIIIPIVPFLVIYFKSILLFFCRYWHLGLYVGAVIGQPFLAYHMTGNNFQRLALQGLWLVFFAIGLLAKDFKWPKSVVTLFVIYALSVYFSWGIPQRFWIMVFFSVGALLLAFIEQARSKDKVLTGTIG